MKVSDIILLVSAPVFIGSVSGCAIITLEPEIPLSIVYIAVAVIAAGVLAIIACSGALVNIIKELADEVEAARLEKENNDE